MVDRHSRAALVALDALDPDELARAQRLIASRPRLAAEVAQLQQTAAYLALTIVVSPRPALRRLVLERVRGVEAEPPQGDVLPGPALAPRRRWVAGLAAAVVVIVLGVSLVGRQSVDDRIADVLAAGDAKTVELGAGNLMATFTFSPELGRGVFSMTDLAAVGVEETYQLWFIDEAGPASAGVFVPDDAGTALVLIGAPRGPGTVLGLTVEPASASSEPTGEILFAQLVS